MQCSGLAPGHDKGGRLQDEADRKSCGSNELDELTVSILEKLRPVGLTQRELVVDAIVKANERERRALLPPKASEAQASRPPSLLRAIRRDGVM